MKNMRIAKELVVVARILKAGVADVILKQMGGMGRLRAMTGAHSFVTSGNDVSFIFPNRQRSMGNAVRVVYDAGKDLYDMEFYNVSINGRKKVASYSGLFFDQLRGTFEKQTGLALRI